MSRSDSELMDSYRLTQQADIDLSSIYQYGISTFGLCRAQRYLLGLHERFQLLADNRYWVVVLKT
jgi:toxin ParE1/3/4